MNIKVNIVLTPEEERREKSVGDKSGWQSWLGNAIEKINETSKKPHMVGNMDLSYLYRNQQNVFTPFELCISLVLKWQEYAGEIKNKYILALNLEIVEILIRDFGIMPEMIEFLTDCADKAKICEKMPQFKGVKVRYMKDFDSFLNGNEPRRFDAVLQNPPYQDSAKGGGQKGTRTHIWQDFVTKAIAVTKPNGFVCSINPGGWRRPYGKFEKVGTELMSKQIHYLELHDIEDGKRTFDASTGYDVIILQNMDCHKKTTVRDVDGIVSEVDMRDVKCIPNGNIPEITKLFAKKDEERVVFITDRSAYGHDKDWVQKEQSEEFKYPVIYSLPQKGEQIWWSSRNDRGHFGISKVIWSNGAATQIIVDEKGEYGMTEWAYALADDPKVLPMIKKAMESENFVELCKGTKFTLDKYDAKTISLFRKNWWEEFV